MLGTFWYENRVDENGNPAGGSLSGKGLSIEWQDGPLGRGEDRKEPNGAFVETVIAAAKSRLVFYQESKFACADNAEMIEHLDAALAIANRRTARREAQQVEGTHALDVPTSGAPDHAIGPTLRNYGACFDDQPFPTGPFTTNPFAIEGGK